MMTKDKEINSLKNIISECEDLQTKFEKERNETFDLIKIKDAEIEKEQQLNNFLKDSENPKSKQ